MRWVALLSVLAGLVLAGCATPEVAKDYETRTYLPAEIVENTSPGWWTWV